MKIAVTIDTTDYADAVITKAPGDRAHVRLTEPTERVWRTMQRLIQAQEAAIFVVDVGTDTDEDAQRLTLIGTAKTSVPTAQWVELSTVYSDGLTAETLHRRPRHRKEGESAHG